MGTIIIFFKLKDRSKIIFFLWTSYVLEKENVKKKNCNWVNFFTFLFVSFIEVGIEFKKKKIRSSFLKLILNYTIIYSYNYCGGQKLTKV